MTYINSLCKKIINKYEPKVIGIAGDFDKDIVKNYVFAVLDYKYKGEVRENDSLDSDFYNSVNNVVLGINKKRSSFFLIIKAFWLLAIKNKKYPKYFVLNYPVNKSGEMKKFLKFVKPDIGILSSVTDRNIEYFSSLKKEADEKGLIVTSLDKKSKAILNIDYEIIEKLESKIKPDIISYGFTEKADIQATEFSSYEKDGDINIEDKIQGIHFKLKHKGTVVPFFIPKVIGSDHVRGFMASVAVGNILGMNMVDISECFLNHKPIKGNFTLVKGVKHTLIIDQTSYIDPYSVALSLETLERLKIDKGHFKYAVIGDISNIIEFSDKKHVEIGKLVAKLGIDYLITIGAKAKHIAKGAKLGKMKKDNCFSFSKAEEAGRFLQDRIKKGDLILVTGSKELGIDKIVKEVSGE